MFPTGCLCVRTRLRGVGQSGPAWDEAHRNAFVEAMDERGHGPSACAAALQALDPNSKISRKTVTGWRNGRTPHASSRRLIRLYLSEEETTGEPNPPQSAVEPPVSADPTVDAFDDIMQSVTQEPRLEDRQAAFVDALIQNLASGDYNEHYTAAREQVARIVGLGSTL